MTNADTNKYPYMLYDNYKSPDPVLYRTVGTTISRLNGYEDVYLSGVIEATIAGKAGDLQPNLWVIGQNISNLTSLDSFYISPGRSFTPHKEGYNTEENSGPQTAFQATPFFTSSLTVGTDTGILKALALRMSTLLQCQDISHAEFPAD
ncbi:MAG: hypothetical protein Q9169_006418, partial [Polycauliona sp. 2 TL-2023]